MSTTVTSTPTQVDAGTAYRVSVTNRSTTVDILVGPGDLLVRPGGRVEFYTDGAPVFARAVTGVATVDVATFAAPIVPSPGGGGLTPVTDWLQQNVSLDLLALGGSAYPEWDVLPDTLPGGFAIGTFTNGSISGSDPSVYLIGEEGVYAFTWSARLLVTAGSGSSALGNLQAYLAFDDDSNGPGSDLLSGGSFYAPADAQTRLWASGACPAVSVPAGTHVQMAVRASYIGSATQLQVDLTTLAVTRLA